MLTLDKEIAPIKCRHGIFYHYAKDTAVGSHLRRFGEWAEEEILLLSLIIKEGWTVLDVGANIGTHTIPFSRLVGPTGRVLAFEPQSRIFPILMMNVITNEAMHNVSALKVLVSDASNPRFSHDKGVTPVGGNMGSHTFTKADPDRMFDGEYILETKIDSLGLSKCDLIKMDIQGYEKFALSGAMKTLLEVKPILYYEQMGLVAHNQISEMLGDCGYVQYVHYARPYNKNNYNKFLGHGINGNVETNILAVPKEKLCSIDFDIINNRKIYLHSIESFTGSHLAAPVKAPWSMSDDSYKGTLLASYIKNIDFESAHAQHLGEIVLAVSSSWYGQQFSMDNIEDFLAFEADCCLINGQGQKINLQILVRSNGEMVWTTLLNEVPSCGDGGEVKLRVTRNCFDYRCIKEMIGAGTVEIRVKSNVDAEQTKIHLHNARLYTMDN